MGFYVSVVWVANILSSRIMTCIKKTCHPPRNRKALKQLVLKQLFNQQTRMMNYKIV